MQRWKSLSRVFLLLALLISLLAGVSAPAFVDADVSAAPKKANSLEVIISEVAWGGTAANSSDEWIELYNPTSSVIDLDNWKIIFADLSPATITIPIGESISPNGYFLLEQVDSAIDNIDADYVYGGSSNMSNTAEVLSLADSTGFIVDTANSGCNNCWYAGSGSPDYFSMERNLPVIADSASAWTSNNGVTRNGLDDVGDPVNGTPHNSQIDLALSANVKSIIGSNVTFTITVSNTGYGTATGVSVKEELIGLTLVSFVPSIGTYNDGIWTIGSLSTGSSQTLDITVIMPSSFVTNSAEILPGDQLDPDLTDNSDSVKIGLPILNITNTVNNSNPAVGTNVIFTITVSNPSPNPYPASNVKVDALLPPVGFTYISSTSTSYNGATGIWDIVSLQINESATLNITARVITSTPPAYSATVTSNEFGDNIATVTFTPLSGQADLSLTQLPYTLSTTTAGNAILKITVTNNGPDNATGVEVKDLLPSGLTFVSYNSTLSTSTYSSSTGVWAINNLAMGAAAAATLNITVKVAASGTSTNNSAQVSKSDLFDPNSTNNSASMEVGVSDLSLLERVDLSTSAAIFTLTLSNSGPDDATGVKVKTLLPLLTSAYTYSSSGPGNSYDKTSGIWDVGSLADGASATLTITTNIVGPLLVNWVEVYASGQVDPDSVPNNSSKTEDDDASAPSADLSLVQSVSNPNPNVGDSVVFTITVSNAGAGGTTNVEVKDLLPTGLTYVSNDLDTAYTKSTGIWKVGTLASGQSKALKITAKVTVNGIKTNWAEVWKSDESDPDSVPGNGSTTEDDDASASITSYRSIIINEVAWAGTGSGTSPNNLANDEWLELYNPSIATIDITGWTLKSASGSLSITLTGSIKSGEYFLLERDDNSTVSDITADQIYTSGLLADSGEFLTLLDSSDNFIDTANKEGGSSNNPWPKGSKLTANYGTMERLGISAESDTTWITNTGTIKIGKDANNGTIFGTPKRANSAGATTPVIPGNPIIPTPGPRLTGRPIINEFLARPGFDWNQDGKVDVFDEYIEIKNVGAVDIVLTGWKLDDEANLGSAAFTLPAITLKPSERYVFYGLETNILLSDGGDSVRLLNPSGQILDSFTYSVAKVEDQSTCRLPDLNTNDFGFGQWLTDCIPTPNFANTREGTIPSMPGGEPFEPFLCSLPDTLPAEFLFAECRGYGSGIWNTYYWDQPGWQGEQYVPENMSKWESFVK